MENSQLARLPPEIRNSIYELALACEHPLKIRLPHYLGKTIADTHPGALRHTCKQIQNESNNLFYTANTFILQLKRESGRSPKPWQIKKLTDEVTAFHAELKYHSFKPRMPVVIDFDGSKRDRFHCRHFRFRRYSELKLLMDLEDFFPTFDYRVRFTIDVCQCFRTRSFLSSHFPESGGLYAFEVPGQGICATLDSMAEVVDVERQDRA